MPAVTPDDTELARRATGGDREAFSLLFDRWLDRAFDVAWHILYNREAAADAAQEAFAAAWTQIGSLRQPESFGGWLLRITRNKALNQLAKQRRSSPVGSEEVLVTMDPREADDPTARLEEGEYGDLVWAASAALGTDDASLLSLHLRHDLGTSELAEELGVKPNAVHQRLFRLKKRLADAIAAWVLWRKGDPSCPDLREILERTEASSFDGTTAKAITNHAGGCEACVSSRKLRLSPEALFAAMPLVVAGPVLRARMVAALGGQGVPTSPASPASADVAEPPETTELEEVSEPGWGDEPPDPDAPADAGDGAALPTPGRSSRWRRTAVGAGIVALVLLLGTVATLTMLADRAVDDTASVETEGRAAPRDPAASSTTSDPATTDAGTATTGQEDDGDGDVGPGPADDPIPSTGPSEVTTTSATTEPAGGEPGARPRILSFTVVPTGQACRSTVGGRIQVEFLWTTTDATSATLGPLGGKAEAVSPSSGPVTRCAQPESTWVLTAYGEGEPVSKSQMVPRAPSSPPPTGPGDIIAP